MRAPVAEDGDQHDQHDRDARRERVGQQDAAERGPGAQRHQETRDRDDGEDAEGGQAALVDAQRRGEEAGDGQEGEAEERQAEGAPDCPRSLARPGQLPAEPRAEDRHEPGDPHQGAASTGLLSEESGRPALQLADEPQQRHGESDDGRHQDQLAGTRGCVVAHRPPRQGVWGAAGILALAVAGQAGRLLERRAPAAPGAAAAPGNVLRLTNRPGPERWPQLSPDGKTLAFVAAAATSPDEGDVFIQRVGGGNAINLTPDSPGHDTHPAFSPDGSRIAFRSEREGGGLFVMGSTGESVKRLADIGYNPSWSPDGREIEDDYQAFTVRPDGSELKRVTALPGGLTFPSWSPDGAEIASRAGLDEQAWRIDLRQPLGEAAARRLPPIDATHSLCARSWSPDGQALAGVAVGPGGVWRGLYVLSLVSGTYRRLGDQLASEVLWLDAKRLVVGTPREILVVDTRSGEARGLARGQSPSLSADGRWLTSVEQSEEADVWMATLP